MRTIEEIVINKVALCVLDRENNTVLLPDSELELTEESYEYFERHILKSLKDEEARTVVFEQNENIVRSLCKEIFQDDGSFMENSRKLAHYLYKCMQNEDKEPSADAVICMFESQQGRHLGILKLNFSNNYSHFIKQNDSKVSITVGINKTGLPGISQKAAKALFVKDTKTEELEVLIVDRQRDGFFTSSFAKCTANRDRRENTKLFHKASENFARKAFKDNAQEAEEFRSMLTDRLRNEDKIEIEEVVKSSLRDEAVRNEYKAVLMSEGITESAVEVDREWAEKKLKRKRLKVDKSIELYIDSDVYNDKDKFQVKRNGDGTIDIILKNVKNYIEK
ncbi:MAG: nucleoid-associated protein [Bacillota bacterium]